MKREDLGMSQDGSRHSKLLTTAESRFLGILWVDHEREENAISADALATEFALEMGDGFTIVNMAAYKHWLAAWKRNIRQMQNHLLIEHNLPIFSRGGHKGGYWIGSEQEGKKFYDSFRARGLTGLTKAARGKQAVLVEMVQQLSFEFDELEDRTGAEVVTIDGRSTPVEVVDAMIRKMMRNPERFSRDLQRLGQKFGSVLLPKAKAQEIGVAAKRLQELVSGLA